MPPKTKDESKPKKREEEKKPVEESQEEQTYVLYKLLCVKQTDSIADIKSSYRRMVLKVHPDKNKEDPDAKDKFAKLTEAYQILSDPDKRREYDQTGVVDGGDFNQDTFQTAYQYYRKLYRKLEKQDIVAFQEKYRHGQMEREDLLEFYRNQGGSMLNLLECIPLSRGEDIPRFIEFFQECMKDKTIERTAKFQKTRSKVRLLKDQEGQFKEEEVRRQKETKRSMSALIASIQGKKSGFLDMLEKKYSKTTTAKKDKKKSK